MKPWHLSLIIAAITIAVFAPSLKNDFVALDDPLLITRNPAVQEISVWSIKHIFTSYDPELYIPLTLFTYQIEHAIFGLNPVIYHVDNLILHIGSAILVFWIFFLLTGKRSAAFLTALLFAIHPIQTEAVVWAAARKDVLSGFLFLASLLCFLLYRRDDEKKFYRGSITLFFLALLSKISIVMLPLILFALDWKDGRRFTKESIKEKYPYLLLSILFGLIAIFGKMRNLAGVSPLTTFLLACKSVLFSLGKIFLPVNLTAFYPEQSPVWITDPLFIGCVIGIAALLAFTLWVMKRSRAIGFGMFFFLLMLLPNLTNFLKNEFLFFATDRSVYLAVLGLFFLIALAADRLIQSGKKTIHTAGLVVITLILLGCAGLTMTQAQTWKDTVALYERGTTLYPRSALLWNNYADYYFQRGDFSKAEEMLERAATLAPQMIVLRTNLGNAYRADSKFDRAESTYTEAIAMIETKEQPGPVELGAYYYLGEMLQQLGRRDEGLRQFQRAAEKRPDLAEPHFNLGLQYQKWGDRTSAEKSFRDAIAADPKYADAHYHLAGLLAEQGKIAEAITELEETIRLDPQNEKAREHLGNLQKIMGNP